jgi:hypothetical protein
MNGTPTTPITTQPCSFSCLSPPLAGTQQQGNPVDIYDFPYPLYYYPMTIEYPRISEVLNQKKSIQKK